MKIRVGSSSLYQRLATSSSPRKISLPFFFNLNHRGRTATLFFYAQTNKYALDPIFTEHVCLLSPFLTEQVRRRSISDIASTARLHFWQRNWAWTPFVWQRFGILPHSLVRCRMHTLNSRSVEDWSFGAGLHGGRGIGREKGSYFVSTQRWLNVFNDWWQGFKF